MRTKDNDKSSSKCF